MNLDAQIIDLQWVIRELNTERLHYQSLVSVAVKQKKKRSHFIHVLKNLTKDQLEAETALDRLRIERRKSEEHDRDTLAAAGMDEQSRWQRFCSFLLEKIS